MSKKRSQPTPLGELTCFDVADKGVGLVHYEGMVVFVPGMIKGEVAEVELLKKKRGYGMGRLVRMTQYSSERTQPVCGHFEDCGGCSWQHMSYAEELAYKEKKVYDALTRIGKLELTDRQPILGCDRQWNYRNKMDYGFSNAIWSKVRPPKRELGAMNTEVQKPKVGGGLGFHAPGRFDKIIDLNTCHLQPHPGNALRLWMRQYALESGLPFYDPRTHKGFYRNLVVRNARTGENMVIAIFGDESHEAVAPCLDALIARFPGRIHSLYYAHNAKFNDSIYDLDLKVYYGAPTIIESLNGVRYHVGPKSFFQTNTRQAEILMQVLRSWAANYDFPTIYDLYCGVGTIGLQLANANSKVIGIETVPEAVELAKQNAALNAIPNAHFYASEVKNVFSQELIAQHGAPDLIVVDPPRNGLEEPVLEEIIASQSPYLVYVSCNPATQARDMQVLGVSYETIGVQPVDMFPHTNHVENIIFAKRKEL